MNKHIINYWNNIVLTILFIIVGFTGLIIFFFLPQGQRSGQQYFWGVIKGTWTAWHNWAGIIMIALMILHLVLYWNVMVCHTKNLFKKKKKVCK